MEIRHGARYKRDTCDFRWGRLFSELEWMDLCRESKRWITCLEKNLKMLTGLNATISFTNDTTTLVSRATPTVADDKLIIGIYGPAYVIAVKRATGELIWTRQLDMHPAAVITMSGTYYGRYVCLVIVDDKEKFFEAGPGGTLGGGTWGAATDNTRVYTNIANSDQKNFTLRPSNNVTTGGGWVSMDAGTGRILWSTAVPYNATTNPVTIANGVLFAGSTYRTGPVYAINAANGEILWSYDTGASVYGGVSVSKGCVYVGHGYRVFPSFTAGNSLFAFCIK
ncbi:hypothetical protein DH2020_009361 [Rehmannia glutinosa]|uniref:Pyrrolo-quinoline quinone repeat domain-containing protein n=1 Tax=Rehmannia glutinosa TaxID=99300 RepID=A0ABR0X631_REHGL